MLVHYLSDEEARPLCGQADAGGWTWSVSPARVTCIGCALLLAERARRERAEHPAGAAPLVPRRRRRAGRPQLKGLLATVAVLAARVLQKL